MTERKATSQLEEVQAVFTWLLYEKPDKSFAIAQYRNIETNKIFVVLGSDLPMKKSLAVKLYGEWVIDRKSGKKQFKMGYYEVARQDTREGIIAYFQSLKCGVGKVKAGNIYSAFGDKTWDVLENDPWRLAEVSSIGASLAERIIKAMKTTSGLRDIVILFLKANVRITAGQANRFAQMHRYPAAALKDNPYCACRVDGITFEKADAVAESLGFPLNHPERMKAFIYKAMADAAIRGHVCLPSNELINTMVIRLNCTEQQCRSTLNAAWQDGIIKMMDHMVYTLKSYEQEERVADETVRLLNSKMDNVPDIVPLISEYEATEHMRLAESQREAVKRVFRSPVSIITGGPGTGKTTIIKAILSVHKAIYGEKSQPLLLAPTGRAARRMSDATGHTAMTIHSAVGYRGEDYAADMTEKLDGNLIIVDEASMMDQFIAGVLLTKCRPGARLVLVGDPNQLPSVGAGNVLLDMITSKVIPTTRLSVIFRQSGDNPIVYNAHAVNEGRTDLKTNDSFQIVLCESYADVFDKAVELYCRCVEESRMDDVVLLNPQRNNTEISVEHFNKVLQERINPHEEGKNELRIGKTTFRIGDRIMQLKNTDFAKNGDAGYIQNIKKVKSADDSESFDDEVYIEFNGDGIIQKYNSDDMKSVDLAYCSTVHKAQGQEYQTVIMVVSKAHPSMLRRNLVYTGITRSRSKVYLISEAPDPGTPSALDIAVQNAACDVRYTNLVTRLRGKN